ncbi:VanW family protein [Deinococcus maricopensis]|uniref:VanW family protein n=1 Tax=Deinococcus maricopensis (strain DSM 21211 / LMG 22137 / NRRL B-23946 / LB-34) TaxID=709986 RepID=E8U5N9_DEIML|nr:VanW family protein [Deinococcus maricopensis]ADV66378.1 VanW family protein [Deinococcus maricopensis DSM 21211]
MNRAPHLLAALLTLSAAAHATTPKPEPLKLVVRTTEPKLQKGKVTDVPVVKSWTLNAQAVARSRKYGKLSSTLNLDHIFNDIERRAPRPATFRNVKGSWVATQQTGWRVDRVATKKALLNALQDGKGEVKVTLNHVVPARNVRTLAERGVLYHVASGTSSFRGSPDFRVTNIIVGAQKLDNFFIAPGHTFDFNKEVGVINAQTGFVKGFVISGGTLSKEDGGGICQVSTTIFRAMYQAGLPVVERHEHSHRVHYYDPVGFEATVYAPTKNLRMKNDTDKHLFVQASWDKRAQTLRFDLFGAQPDRTVNISKPVVTNFKAPAPATYTPDPRVRVGGRRLLDQPMQGMTSVITRTVKLPGGQVRKDTLKSVYKPWGAVYGVNPRDNRLR